MKWRVMVELTELTASDGTVRTHEISTGGSNENGHIQPKINRGYSKLALNGQSVAKWQRAFPVIFTPAGNIEGVSRPHKIHLP